MSTDAALAVVLVVMAAVNVWVHLGPRRAHLVTGPLAAVGLLLVARAAGLSWAELGLGRSALDRGAVVAVAAAGLVAAAYAVALAVPAARTAFRDSRYRLRAGPALATALLAVPLATVVFEEVAFRGVLWGLVAQDHGAAWATASSSVLFGLWHVLPALAAARTNAALRAVRRSAVLPVLGTVLFTAAAGVVFAELRRRTGSLVAPIGLHWATNGFGVLASAWVWAVSRREGRASA
jgi:membrane protease YdiL (CAAX protease family)